MTTVENLSFAYGTIPILKNLSFRCGEGLLVALMGENGSGKSTLLSCLAGLRDVPGVSWGDRAVSEWSREEQARHRALVPQHPRFDPAMVLYDYVLLGRKPWFRWKEGEEDHRIVSGILDRFGLSSLAFRSLSDVSGGERQKAVLARAFAQDTPLLLLDEPLNNLDLRFQISFMTALRNRARETGVLVIAALHDINAALSWCDSALLMKDGRLIAEGQLEESLTEKTLEEMFGVRTTFFDFGGKRQMVIPDSTE